MFGTKAEHKPIEEVVNLKIPLDNLSKAVGSTDIPILLEEACKKVILEVEQGMAKETRTETTMEGTNDGMSNTKGIRFKEASDQKAKEKLINTATTQGETITN